MSGSSKHDGADDLDRHSRGCAAALPDASNLFSPAPLAMRWPAADRKAGIMDAAMSRIVRFGFEGLRIRDVAQDVGINNATLHYHFPTKADLIRALVERFVASFHDEDAVPDGSDLDERLAAYVGRRRARMERAPEPFVVFNELMTLARRDTEVRGAIIGLHDHWLNYLVTICREAGLDAPSAKARAERCRRELIGASLELSLTRPVRSIEDETS